MPLSFRQLFSCIKLADLQAKTCENHLHAWIQHDPTYPINIRTYSKSTITVIKCHLMPNGGAGCPAMEHIVLVQPMRETPPLQPRGQKDVNGSNAWLNVPAWPKTSCASQRIVLHWHWRQRIGWKIKMECLKLLILTAACSWDIERDKETKKLRNSHTLAYVMRKQITAAIAHRVNISVRNTQMIHLLICNLIRHEVSGKGKSKLRPKGMWQM